MSQEAFHRILYQDSKLEDIRNDTLKGMIVSDSHPLKKEDLALYQKVDLSLHGNPRVIPMLRECLRPGTNLSFTITVDSTICSYKGQDIVDAVTHFYKNYKAEFMNRFSDAPSPGEYKEIFFLGGGSGYVSKTSVYGVMHGEHARSQVGVILNNSLPERVRRSHGHLKDAEKGASPHVLKCTRGMDGKLMQMGACRILSIRRLNKEEMNS